MAESPMLTPEARNAALAEFDADLRTGRGTSMKEALEAFLAAQDREALMDMVAKELEGLLVWDAYAGETVACDSPSNMARAVVDALLGRPAWRT